MLKVICPYCQCCFDTDDISDEGIVSCCQCGKQFLINIPADQSENNAVPETDPQDNSQTKIAEETSGIKHFLHTNINIILIAVNAAVTLIALSGALYMWLYRQEIHDGILAEKQKEVLKKYSEECETNLNDFGKFLLHYAEKNDGKLPAEINFRDEYTKYANLSYVSVRCTACSGYDMHFNKMVLKKDNKNADTVLISCPEHKRGFFADGECRSYSEEDNK